MNITVIIPTHNEAGAIAGVIENVLSSVAAAPEHRWSVLVVDGNSTDGTADIVREFAARMGNVRLLEEGKKRGLALAYASGIRHAIGILNADAFVEFDGDGQHDPRYLPAMARALEDGADYVIGSRYVAGGSVPRQWKMFYRLLSRFGSLYARLLLELPVHDVTSGFKMSRVAGFADNLSLDEESLLTRHYAYKIQLLWEMRELGARIQEIPISFRHREKGDSKSTKIDIIESLRVTAILRIKSLREWRLLRVLAIGGFGVILQGIIFELLGIRWKVLSPGLATLAGAEFVVLCNFFLNERFAFRDRVTVDSLWTRMLRFHLVASGSVACQWLFVTVASFFTSNPILLRLDFIAAVGIGFFVNYAGYYFLVWNREK